MRDRHGVWCAAWSLVLTVLALGPALGPGYVLAYDMVWVPDLAVRPDFLGLSSGLPRAVPSDAVVAVLDEVVPGMLLQKVVLVVALALGGIGASRLAPAVLPARLAATALYVWNPLVAERLLIGHWPVLLGYAVLPWLVLGARAWRSTGRMPLVLLLLVPLGSLSASAGLASAAVLAAFAAGGRRWLPLGLLVAAANAPWLVAGLTASASATVDRASATVFALRGEGEMPAPLAALTLGGIWNAEVVPASREGALGWAALVLLLGLAAAGAVPWWRTTPGRERVAHLACWSAGWLIAVATWAAPGVLGEAMARVPGLGMVRDGSRVVVLCAPLLVVLVAQGVVVLWRRVPALRAARLAAGAAVALLPVALLPDLAWGAGGRLRPADYPTSWEDARVALGSSADGDVLVLPFSSYRQPAWNHDGKVLDPLGRYLDRDYLANDDLSVSGTPVAGEDPRAAAAAAALGRPTPAERAAALVRIGIDAAVVDLTAPGAADVPLVEGIRVLDTGDLVVVDLPGGPARSAPTGTRVALAVAWTAYAAGPLAGGVLLLARRRREVRRSSLLG